LKFLFNKKNIYQQKKREKEKEKEKGEKKATKCNKILILLIINLSFI